MDSLPSELLLHIFQFTEKHERFRLRSINRRFCQLATSFAFDTDTLRLQLNSRARTQLLLKGIFIRDYIRDVEIAFPDDIGIAASGQRTKLKERMAFLDSVVASVAIFRTLPSFHSLTVSFPAAVFGEWLRSTHSSKCINFVLQRAVLDTLRVSGPLTALRSLIIHDLIPAHHPTAFASFVSNNPYPHLTHLHLSTIKSSILPAHELRWLEITGFWQLTVLPFVRFCSATLTDLTLECADDVGAPVVCFARLYIPHLARLSLTRILFDEETGTEAFILRHASTLTALKLPYCKIAFGAHETGPARTWADIYRSLGDGLPLLSETTPFVPMDWIWETALDFPGRFIKVPHSTAYAQATPGARCEWGTEFPGAIQHPREFSDDAAWNDLLRIVRARSSEQSARGI
ncbi:hypothetical protein FA95DRAFT_1606154 [Auriscalpium vulgare]|uniref:Uncharacterized protein n=1 Tax=Auriscalpium vulgare TaxID=40419 RepID=A0ACB8RUS3_9AGAM|nr:hypothetical protein FA95DRAFT_1606154 [Auriscalpium vulgare]